MGLLPPAMGLLGPDGGRCSKNVESQRLRVRTSSCADARHAAKTANTTFIGPPRIDRRTDLLILSAISVHVVSCRPPERDVLLCPKSRCRCVTFGPPSFCNGHGAHRFR